MARMFVPANGGAMVERMWIDDRGNPSLYRFIIWVGFGQALELKDPEAEMETSPKAVNIVGSSHYSPGSRL